MNLMMLLEMASSGFGDRVAVTSGDTALTYQQLIGASRRVARLVADAGVERVAMLDISSPAVPDRRCSARAWAGSTVRSAQLPPHRAMSCRALLASQIKPAYLDDGRRTCSTRSMALPDGSRSVHPDVGLFWTRFERAKRTPGARTNGRWIGDDIADSIVHQRHHGGAQGGRAPTQASGFLHPRLGGVHGPRPRRTLR